MYLVPGSSSLSGQHPRLGVIAGPRSGHLAGVREGRRWAADNDAFHGRFDPSEFRAMLTKLAPYRAACLFVTAPDIRLDAQGTLDLFATWGPVLRDLGFPVAYVAQDGSEHLPLPDADALFIGGSDAWRDRHAAGLIWRAKERAWWVHFGRVNSLARNVACARLGVDSADGTYLRFKGNETGLADISRWLTEAGQVPRALLGEPGRGSAPLYLISCASGKQDRPVTAQDLYTGQWFAKARRYAERQHADWHVLSALHGFLPRTAVTAPYDVTLGTLPKAERLAWAERTMAQFRRRYAPGRHVVLLAGERYREHLTPLLEQYGCSTEVPMRGLGIGEQLAWLKRHTLP